MKVTIITEGKFGTGYGHLTRCLSIYQAFEERNITPLYIANCDEGGKKIVGNINMIEFNWLNNLEKLYELLKDADIAIIDSYLAPIEIFEDIQKLVKKAVYIDDYLRLDYPPGIIINGTVGAENLPYKKDDNHQYLLGIDYMPLRKEFWDVEFQQKQNNGIKNILITFGGQDFRELTFPVLELLLSKYPVFNYHVVKGNYDRATQFKDYGNNVEFYTELNAKEMLGLMLKCDIAVSAAGQTTYELARIGIKTIAIGIAENQKNNITGWLSKGFIEKEIWYSDPPFFDNLSDAFDNYTKTNLRRKIFNDGMGARRIYFKSTQQNERI